MLEMLQRFANEVGEVIAVECVVLFSPFSVASRTRRTTERAGSRFGAGSTPRVQTFQVPFARCSRVLRVPTPSHAPLTMLLCFRDRAHLSGHPPPAYHQGALAEYMKLLASFASRNLLVGVKLPPFTYQGGAGSPSQNSTRTDSASGADGFYLARARADQFEAVVAALRSVGSPSEKYHPIAFLTATNTLGQGESVCLAFFFLLRLE